MDNFESWLWVWLAQAIAWYLGYKYGQHITAMRITRLLIDRDPDLAQAIEKARKDIEKINSDPKSNSAEEVRVEQHGNQIYVYTLANDEFLAQGSTLEECLDRIGQRFPDRNFRGLLSKEQADSLAITSDKTAN